MKRLTEEEIANFPHKNVIVRALGMKDTVKVDTRFDSPQLDDTIPAVLRRALSGPGHGSKRCKRSCRCART
jgi:PPM family protein phosphatase